MVDFRFLRVGKWPFLSVYQYQNLAEIVNAQIQCLGHQYRYTNVEADVI